MGNFAKYGVIAAVVVAGLYFMENTDSGSYDSAGYTEEDIDLNAVLDTTIDTIYAYEDKVQAIPETERNPDEAFLGFTEDLKVAYNSAQPALHSTTIGVLPQNDASVLAFEDSNANGTHEESEPLLFLVEIDGENSRVIASSNSGAVNDHHFSGTSLLAGYLLGSMLSRQRMNGNPSALANKKPVTARQAARSRAGSGSHSRGK